MSRLATLNGSMAKKDVFKMRDDFLHPFQQFFDQTFESLISDFFSESGKSSIKSRSSYPKLDSYFTTDSFIIEVAIPGVAKEDIDIETNIEDSNKYVKITGKMEEDISDKNHCVRELRRSSFSRIVGVPETAEGDPSAVLKDGILKLIWKIKEEPKAIIGKKIIVE